MALEIKLSQKMSQSLVMTPQLQQAIKLLQLGRQEYAEVLEKELLENPVLEDARDTNDDAPMRQESQDNQENSTSENSQENNDFEFDRKEILKALSESEGVGASYTASGGVNYSEDDRPPLEATVQSKDGLSSHLLWQLRTADFTAEQIDIAVQIIGNLDRNGYLEASVSEIASECRVSEEEVAVMLAEIQALDPIGIGARDLRECLLIQLDQLGLGDKLIWSLVSEHLDKLELRKYDEIAKAEGVSVEEVYEAVKEIQQLDPRPGRPFADEESIYITPDVYVRKVGNDYLVTLNEAGMPKLRLSPMYRELLTKGTIEDIAGKEYLQDRLRSAAWLIKSIHQRQQTILKVTEKIMEVQRDFLEQGVSGLKPLVLREIADAIEMHESTVSRVTTNKYVHTPQGVFELKYFFSSGLKSGDGVVSSETVKEKIKALVAKENPKKPLSDQAIVTSLKNDGIDIARRTVAKYRDMLGILSSSRRKKMF